MNYILSSRGGKMDNIHESYSRIYDTCINKLYSELDVAHGKWHIDHTILNVTKFYTEMYFDARYNEEITKFSINDVTIMMLFHDLGNSRTVWEATGKICKETEIREYHHMISKVLFDLLINAKTPITVCGISSVDLQNVVTDDKYVRKAISDGIMNHRASRSKEKKYSLIDDLARCSDGFNEAEVILERSLIYNIQHHYDPLKLDLEGCINESLKHIFKKYNIEDGYACELPLKEVNDEYKREIRMLQDYAECPNAVYLMIKTDKFHKITEILNKYKICLND